MTGFDYLKIRRLQSADHRKADHYLIFRTTITRGGDIGAMEVTQPGMLAVPNIGKRVRSPALATRLEHDNHDAPRSREEQSSPKGRPDPASRISRRRGPITEPCKLAEVSQFEGYVALAEGFPP